jgi:putative hydrolase of the HAD superfamily
MPHTTPTEQTPFKAVCFDLFDTLIEFDTAEYRALHDTIADVTGIDRESFKAAWLRSRNPAVAGMFASHLDRLTAALKQLGVTEEADLASARAVERKAIRAATGVIPGTIPLLADLVRRNGLLGLISNATAAGRLIMAETRLDDFFSELIFSYDVKLRKPDPKIFVLACDRLRVPPHRTAYVADGSRGELHGALQAGLTPLYFDPLRINIDQPMPPGTLVCPDIDSLRNILLD